MPLQISDLSLFSKSEQVVLPTLFIFQSIFEYKCILKTVRQLFVLIMEEFWKIDKRILQFKRHVIEKKCVCFLLSKR